MHAILEETACVKLQDKSTNNKGVNLTSNIVQNWYFLETKTHLLKIYTIYPLSFPTQLCAPISTKWSSPSQKIEKSNSKIRSSAKIYVGKKMKYTYNVTIVIDDVVIRSTNKNTSADS